LCNMICAQAFAELTQCLELVIARCLLTGPGYFECALVGGAMCLTASGLACGIACSSLTSILGLQANIQTGQTLQTGASCPFHNGQPCGSVRCGTCESCIDGICTATTCPTGYSCDSTIGTCVCSNLCGTQCCSSPSQTCSNGSCVANPCDNCVQLYGAGYSFCGGCGQTVSCCPPGNYCLDSTRGVCCPQASIGASVCTGGMPFCCSPGYTCCYNNIGSYFCCGPGETCAPGGVNGCVVS
jgi:hypothetical protein